MNSPNAESPIFVVSPVRSGSTMLHLILDSHPSICNPGECDFFFDLSDGSSNYPDVGVYQKLLSTNRIFNAINLKIDDNLSYRELMGSFLKQLSTPKNLLTLNVHRNFQYIPGLFPEAKYIHLLRDPRDVTRSSIGMGWAGHVYYGVDIWIAAERSWGQLRSTLDEGQYMEVRYEELVTNPELTLKTVCEFMGKSYSKEMMDYAKHSSYKLPDRRLIYQWKEKLLLVNWPWLKAKSVV